MSEKLSAGQFPVLHRGKTHHHFVQHQQALPQRVVLPTGDLVETGYLRVTGEQTFNLYELCQNNGKSEKLVIQNIAYIDDGDNLCDTPVVKLAPIKLNDPAYVSGRSAKIVVGYTTKICGLRWGFILTLDPRSGVCSIATDQESPIVGLKVQFQ